MIWIVDKKVVRHLLTRGKLLAEVPLRVSFEYAIDDGEVVEGSLSMKVLYNSRSVSKSFPGIEEEAFNQEVQKTASEAVSEHLAMSGIANAGEPIESVVIAAH